MDRHVEIAVIGSGMAGAVAAHALARTGRSVALVGQPATVPDGRTTALMAQSIDFLNRIGLWDSVSPIAAPLAAIRIIDGTRRLLRAPTVTFRAAEVGRDAFGYNIPNALFLEELARHHPPSLVLFPVNLARIDPADQALVLEDGTRLTADLIVGADGRNSMVRQAAGIDVRTWSYPQTAVVFNFAHERSHENISTEFHTESGPFTQVPLPGNRSSLVWVRTPEEAAATIELSPEALGLAVETGLQSILGRVTVEGPARSFPLSGMVARRYGSGRSVLVGEAGHAFPPIGAQGLNLSLRDVVTLVDLIGDGPIPADLADRYDRRRRADVLSRTASVDILNRSLLSAFLPVQMLRAGGLHLLSAIGPLRGMMMREGMQPGGILDSLRDKLRKRA